MLTLNLDKIKRHIGISINYTEDDEKLRELFQFVTADVEKYIGFDLSATTYTEEKHVLNWFESAIYTEAFPINSITEITVNTTAISSDYYYYDGRTGQIIIRNTYNLNLGYQKNQFLVTYNAGHSTFPRDVEKEIYRNIKYEHFEGGIDIQRTKDLSSEEQRRELTGNLLPDTYRVLNGYKRNVH